MKAASALTVTIMMIRPDRVHSQLARGLLSPQPAVRRRVAVRNGGCANVQPADYGAVSGSSLSSKSATSSNASATFSAGNSSS